MDLNRLQRRKRPELLGERKKMRYIETGARSRHLPPAFAQGVAMILLLISFRLPFWQMTVTTSEHPQGKRLTSYLDDLRGPPFSPLPSAENHDAPLWADLAELERSFDAARVIVTGLLLIAIAFVRNRWAALLALPAVCFPLIVVADTAECLLELMASLSTGTDPLQVSPAFLIFGRLAAGGISLEARPGAGLIVAAAAAIAVIVGLCLHLLKGTPARDTTG